jgi:predicted CopG family antitoxin
MEKTTIALRKDVRDAVVELGNKGETYSDILERLVRIAKQNQLRELLMDEKDTITIEEARKRLDKKWPRS